MLALKVVELQVSNKFGLPLDVASDAQEQSGGGFSM